MRKHTLLIYGLAIALSGSALAFAGDGQPGMGKGKHREPPGRSERMRQHLDLTDEQASQMDAIRNSDASPEEKRARMQEILTEEQRAKMEAHRGMSRGIGRGKPPRGNPEERIERMRQHLDLTDEQVSEMEAIRDSSASRVEKRQQMHEILTDEQRARIDAHRAARRDGPGPYGREDEDEIN